MDFMRCLKTCLQTYRQNSVLVLVLDSAAREATSPLFFLLALLCLRTRMMIRSLIRAASLSMHGHIRPHTHHVCIVRQAALWVIKCKYLA